jgi:hypothetical protein
LLLLCVTSGALAQIVNIPDANFKNTLLSASPSNGVAYGYGGYIKIDDNNDGEIQESEAAVVDSLNVSSSSIWDLSGVSAFSNLKKLRCNSNSLYSIDLAGLNLTYLDCSGNYLSSLDVSTMTNLSYLNCFENNISSLSLSALTNLEVLYCDLNELATLDVHNNTSLERLSLAGNHLTTLDLSGLSALKYMSALDNDLTTINLNGLDQLEVLNLRENNFTSLTISDFPNLEYFYCEDNFITTLIVQNLPSLLELRAGHNLYTSLDISTLQNLYVADVIATPLTSLDCSGLANLYVIYAHSDGFNPGMLSSLTLTGCESLNGMYLEGNQLTTIDASDCHSLTYLDANNNNLETVFVKNGSIEDVYVDGNENLSFICADDNQIQQVVNWLEQYDMTDVACNSYCSFTPGAPYNTISGVFHFDDDGNGCTSTDVTIGSARLDINDGNTIGATFANLAGNYSTVAQQPSITLTPSIENQSFFTISPATETVNFADNDYHTEIRNFCVSANGVHPDVEISLVPLVPARPGFNAQYVLSYHNKGNQMLSGNIVLMFQDAVLDYVYSDVAPDSQATNALTWNYSGLMPFESRSIQFTLHVNAPTDTPAVNIGDELNFSATVNPVAGDEFPADNVFGYKQTVVGSYDPNDKQCMQGDIVSPMQIGEYLHYVINFENTGTFAAENVVIKDLIDADKFDINSLQVLGASHSEVPTITGNKVEFVFQGINLQPNEYGYVAFKIKTKPDLAVNTTVTNKANIYFDFNFPVETNTASTTFQNLGIGETPTDNSLRVFPNPATETVNIQSGAIIRQVAIYDVQGRRLSRYHFDENHTRISLSGVQPGVYVLRMITDAGSKTEKLIKK